MCVNVFQASEKTVGETIPNPKKKNGSTIKDVSGKCLLPVGANIGINTFSSHFGLQIEAPGKHLKPGVEVESSKRRESESGRYVVLFSYFIYLVILGSMTIQFFGSYISFLKTMFNMVL